MSTINRPIRSIISTGQGRLHLIQSACAIQQAGVDVRVITGWAPYRMPDGLINFLGRTVGKKNLAYGMRKRRPAELRNEQLHTCTAAEFLQQGLFKAARIQLIDRSKAAQWGWRFFGWSSRRYLHDADVFQLRSGAGRGGALETAKRRGMVTLADHSIAHPATIERNLQAVTDTRGRAMFIRPEDLFWKNVLRDCEEADYLLVNSDYVKQTFLEQGYDADRIHVAYLGVRDDFMGLKQNHEREETFRLLFTGGFGLRKGANRLLEAVLLLRQTGLKFQLDVVGSVDVELKIPEELKQRQDVVFHGYLPQDRLKEFLSTADAYVFPSYAEGAAQSAMEALAAGLPAVLTSEAGTPATHEQTALIIPRDNAQAIADAVVRLSEDEALRRKLGGNAATMMREHHTWLDHGKRVREIYEQVLAAR